MLPEKIYEKLTEAAKKRQEEKLPYVVQTLADPETNTIWVLYDDYIEGSNRMWGLWTSREENDFCKMTDEAVDAYLDDFLEGC